MQTELLIARLARHAGPVRVLPPLRKQMVYWALLSVASVAAGVAWFGARGDAVTRLVTPEFLFRALLTMAVATAAAYHALSWSVPGSEPHGPERVAPQVALGVWTLAVAWPLLGPTMVGTMQATAWHPQCAWQMGTVAVVPMVWLLWRVEQAAPHALGWISVQLALAAAAVGAVATQWICGLDGAAHQLLWHVSPLLILTGAISVVGRGVLRRH